MSQKLNSGEDTPGSFKNRKVAYCLDFLVSLGGF
jgi:hypothetical protein